MRKITWLTLLITGALIFQGCKKEPPPDNNEEYATSLSRPELTVYEAPSGAPKNFTYSVLVRFEGGDWIDLYEYDAGVDGGFGTAPLGHMSFVYFDADFSKRIDVKVEKRSGTVNDVDIRPASAGIEPEVNGNVIEFSLKKPQKLSVEVNGDQLNNLMIFANGLETDIPDSTDTKVHYFGPGIHKMGEDGTGTLTVKSDEMVYIAGGAIVYGHIAVKDPGYRRISNVTIRGRGILSGDMETTHPYSNPDHAKTPPLILLNIVQDVNIEGIILHNTVTWNIHMYFCKRVVARNLKIMSWTINSDGIDPQVCSDVTIEDCFIRNHDDCTSIKLNWFQGNNTPPADQSLTGKNIVIQNSIFWTDQGRAVLIGPELASPYSGQVVEDVTVRNMDILYTENYSSAGTEWAKGVLAINCGDDATVRNVSYDDIRVDKIGPETNLITLNFVDAPYAGSVGKSIENISFNNVSLNSALPLKNIIYGYSADRTVNGVSFTDLMINGSYIHNAEEGDFDINEFAGNITFVVN